MGESFIELEVVAQLKMLCVAQMISMWARMQPISGIRQVPTKPAKKWHLVRAEELDRSKVLPGKGV